MRVTCSVSFVAERKMQKVHEIYLQTERERERVSKKDCKKERKKERRVKEKVTHSPLPCVCVKANYILMVPSSNCNYVIFLRRMWITEQRARERARERERENSARKICCMIDLDSVSKLLGIWREENKVTSRLGKLSLFSSSLLVSSALSLALSFRCFWFLFFCFLLALFNEPDR